VEGKAVSFISRVQREVLSGQRYASGSRTSGPDGSGINLVSKTKLPSGYVLETKGIKLLLLEYSDSLGYAGV
jgi:hypothetical protein